MPPVRTILLVICACAPAAAADTQGEPISFNRDIRPILSNNCYACHGPDDGAREADLRLDTREGAHSVLQAGESADSELFRRVSSTDPDEQMPPPDANRQPTPEQIQLLKRWIDEGASWGEHWSFGELTKPPLPPSSKSDDSRVRNPIDLFIQAELEKRGLDPSPEAPPQTLIRRVTLDLTGLPPTPAEVDAFLSDDAPDAYERLVDRLLASPAYGERMAWNWLDAARYADSNGYQGDRERTMWPWRDWVIDAFNRNQPYDAFTVWQLAGDLLPDASFESRLATGFCRNHMINGEGGRIAEENRVDYVMDMTETTGTVWLGLTLNCCRCHDHKFDQLTQREYYRLFAFFNQTPVTGGGGDPQTPPVLAAPSASQRARLARLEAELVNLGSEDAARKGELKKQLEALRKSLPKVMVMQDQPKRRPTYRLVRGLYNKPGEEVVAGVPSVLPSLPSANEQDPANRLNLARWLVSDEHPLTARVTVNRFWQQLFGVGLVKTTEDFGVQGEIPLHQDLLDWLAADFRDHDWNVKRLIRQMVTSHTYRQSSKLAPQLVERDPENRLLARAARYRLPSWMIRDQALAASGLLVRRQGGPPVNTYQPPGVWEEATFGKKKYQQDHGAALYRRSLYTFWRRIIAPTMFFDNASRQTCTVRTLRTNTPLHALLTLNDITYVEAARALAQRVLLADGMSERERIDEVYRRLLARRPSEREQTILLDGLGRSRAEFEDDPDAARKLLSVGQSARDERLEPAQHAAWTSLCLAVLNLDETLTKE